jgi:hypothetical protein
LLGMMLLSSVSIPHVNALCPGSTKEAFPANGDDLRSEATSYIADPAAWRTTTASGATLTNEVRFGTNIVSFAPDAHTHTLFSKQASRASLTTYFVCQGDWNVGSVTDFDSVIRSKPNFNESIENWCVSAGVTFVSGDLWPVWDSTWMHISNLNFLFLSRRETCLTVHGTLISRWIVGT